MLLMVYHQEEAGTKAEAMEGDCLLANSPWLVSLLSSTAQTACSEVALLTVGRALP